MDSIPSKSMRLPLLAEGALFGAFPDGARPTNYLPQDNTIPTGRTGGGHPRRRVRSHPCSGPQPRQNRHRLPCDRCDQIEVHVHRQNRQACILGGGRNQEVWD